MKTIVIALIALVLAFVAFSFYVSQPVVEGTQGSFEPVIADRADALTFARTPEGLILVTQHEGDALIGVNLAKRFGESWILFKSCTHTFGREFFDVGQRDVV